MGEGRQTEVCAPGAKNPRYASENVQSVLITVMLTRPQPAEAMTHKADAVTHEARFVGLKAEFDHEAAVVWKTEKFVMVH